MAASVVDFFAQGKVKKLIARLKSCGVNTVQKSGKTPTVLSGKTFVFTGELKGFSRKQAREMVKGLGGDWSSAVSKNTDYVVAGDNPGSKYNKAKRLKLKIISEAEFKKITKGKTR